MVVLEARDRVGGRVHSVPFAGGLVERGAEFVFDDHDQVQALCARFGLTLADKGFPYGDREPRGGVPTTRAEVVAAAAGLEQRGRGGGTIADAVERLDASAGARAAVRARLEMTHATPADELAASVLADSGSSFGDYSSSTVVEGNQAIATGLAAGLPDVRLGAPVRAVAWAPGGGAAHGRRRGGRDAADRVVVAVPPPVLGEIAFTPALPGEQRDALGARAHRPRREALPRADGAGAAVERDGAGRALLDLHLARRGRGRAAGGRRVRRHARRRRTRSCPAGTRRRGWPRSRGCAPTSRSTPARRWRRRGTTIRGRAARTARR